MKRLIDFTGDMHQILRPSLILLFLAFTLLHVGTSGQERQGPFIIYRAGAGISNGLNFHVCQSKDGYLWIGTGNGLVKFDGNRYRRIVAGPGSITDNLVVDVAEASDGKIWIAGFSSGLSRFDPHLQTFRRYPVIGRSGNNMQQVKKILPLPNGQVWLGTGNMGLALYEQATDSFRFFTPGPRFDKSGNLSQHYTVNDIIRDRRDTTALWLVIGGDIYKFSTLSFTFEKLPILSRERLPGLLFTSLASDGTNGLWLGTWGYGMKHYDIQSHRLEHLGYRDESGKMVHGLLALDVEAIDDSTVLWACALTGLIRHNPLKGTFINMAPNTGEPFHSSEATDYQSISVLPDAGVFIGASGCLLQMHPRFNRLGRIWIPSPSNKSDQLIVTKLLMTEDETACYLACAGPVSLLRVKSHDLSREVIPVKHPSKTKGIADMVWLSETEILALGYDGLLYTLRIDEKSMKPSSFAGLPSRLFDALETDRKEYLWLLAQKTLFRIRLSTMTVTDSFVIQNKNTVKKYADWPFHLFHLMADSRGRAWISSNQGLWLADPEDHTILQISPETPEGRWMRNDLIKSCLIDPEDRLWIGYNGDGLQVMDTRTLQPVDSVSGLSVPCQQINDMAITPRGKFLASTSEGLLEIDGNDKGWQLFGVQDGLTGQDIGTGLHAASNGMVFVPFFNSYNVFDENVLDIYHDNLKINITSLMVNGKEQNLAAFLNNAPDLRLTHQQNNISLDFAAMHWQYPFRTKYSFRLFEGEDTTAWYSLAEPSLHLSALKPGKYTLQLAALGAGNTASWPKKINLTIKPPFWLESWFIFMSNVLVIGIIYGLYRFRLNQLRKPLEARNAISQNLHDDIGSSLSHIQILTELASRNLGNPEKSKSLLEKSGEDLHRISEALSDIVWNINPRYDDLNNLFIRMKRFAADAFEGKQIVHELQFPELEGDMKMKMERRRDFYLIFKESVHNLVKYARATKALVRVEVRNKQVIMTITDDGVGFDQNNPGTGNGLTNMYQRAVRNQGTLDIRSERGKGTTVCLKLPIH